MSGKSMLKKEIDQYYELAEPIDYSRIDRRLNNPDFVALLKDLCKKKPTSLDRLQTLESQIAELPDTRERNKLSWDLANIRYNIAQNMDSLWFEQHLKTSGNLLDKLSCSFEGDICAIQKLSYDGLTSLKSELEAELPEAFKKFKRDKSKVVINNEYIRDYIMHFIKAAIYASDAEIRRLLEIAANPDLLKEASLKALTEHVRSGLTVKDSLSRFIDFCKNQFGEKRGLLNVIYKNLHKEKLLPSRTHSNSKRDSNFTTLAQFEFELSQFTTIKLYYAYSEAISALASIPSQDEKTRNTINKLKTKQLRLAKQFIVNNTYQDYPSILFVLAKNIDRLADTCEKRVSEKLTNACKRILKGLSQGTNYLTITKKDNALLPYNLATEEIPVISGRRVDLNLAIENISTIFKEEIPDPERQQIPSPARAPTAGAGNRATPRSVLPKTKPRNESERQTLRALAGLRSSVKAIHGVPTAQLLDNDTRTPKVKRRLFNGARALELKGTTAQELARASQTDKELDQAAAPEPSARKRDLKANANLLALKRRKVDQTATAEKKQTGGMQHIQRTTTRPFEHTNPVVMSADPITKAVNQALISQGLDPNEPKNASLASTIRETLSKTIPSMSTLPGPHMPGAYTPGTYSTPTYPQHLLGAGQTHGQHWPTPSPRAAFVLSPPTTTPPGLSHSDIPSTSAPL